MTSSDPDWGPWVDLAAVVGNPHIPRSPGIYRIRRVGASQFDYIGQTGRTLRERLRALAPIFGDVMPYNDPHTAGPGFWALRQEGAEGFEYSVAVFEGSDQLRKGRESLEISRHRMNLGSSPTLNFGRMPDGWSKSSGNTAALVRAGKRRRGGPDPTARRSRDAPPPASLAGSPFGDEWLGHRWSRWSEAVDPPVGAVGLYRARRPGRDTLHYIGQGRASDRMASHRRATDRFPADTQWSWTPVRVDVGAQALELENDLIAGHVWELGCPPTVQFRGGPA